MDEPVNKMRRVTTINETSRFSDLDKIEQERILEQKNIIFQGNETNLNELLAPLAKLDLDYIIDSHVLMKFSKNEKITVGRKLSPLDETVGKYYIPRLIHKLDALPVNCEIFPEKKLRQLDRFDHKEVVILGGAAGTGKSTLLTNLANAIKRERPNLWVIKIDLGNYLKSFREFRENNVKSVTLEDLLNSNLESKLENVFEKKILSLSHKVIIMLDGIDEVCLDYKNLLLSVIGDCLTRCSCERGFFDKRPTYFLVLAASLSAYQELEQKLSHTLEPFSEKDQVDCLTNYWQQKFQLNDSKRARCRLYAETVIEEKWLQVKGIEQLVGIPLVIRMISEILEKSENFDDGVSEWEGCYNFLSSTSIKPLLPKKLELVDLYRLFIYKNCFRGTKIGLNLLRDAISKINIECNGYLHILALETVLTKKTCDYFNCYKTRTPVIPEDKLLSFRILKKVGHEFKFTHRTFAEYFIAESILIELCEPKNEEFLTFFFKEALITDGFNLVRMFVDNVIQTGLNHLQEEFLKVIGRSLKQADSSLLLYISAKEGSLGILTFLFKCFEVANIPVDINSVRVKGDLPLHSAVEGGDLQVVQFLIENGVSIDTRDKNDSTSLHLAAETGSLAMVKFLVEHGVEVSCKDGKGRTALHIAAKNDSFEMVKYLLMHGADINSRTNDGFTALHIAAGMGDLEKVKYLVENGADIICRGERSGMVISNAVASGELSIVKYLVEKGADVTVRNNQGGTMLHLVPKRNTNDLLKKVMELSKFLIDKGVDINAVDNSGDTVLHTSIGRKYELEFIKFLVEQGANVRLINYYQRTPLSKAMLVGDLKIVEYLMDNGAELNTSESVLDDIVMHNHFNIVNNHELLQFLFDKSIEVDKTNIFFKAACEGNLSVVRYLTEKGIDVNARDKNDSNNSTALHKAAERNHVFVLNYLIEHGANVDIKDMAERTPLLVAATHGCLQAVKLLVDKGADVSSISKSFGSALTQVVRVNFIDGVKFLVERGAQFNVKSEAFGTPLYIAFIQGNLEIAEYLLENDPDFKCKIEDLVKRLVTTDEVECDEFDLNENRELLQAIFSRLDTVRYLIEKGVEFNSREINKYDLLIKAAKDGDSKLVKYFIDQGGDVNNREYFGRTALFETTDVNMINMAKLLVQNGADVNAKEKQGCSVLRNAIKKSNLDMCKFLIASGADINEEDAEGRTLLHMKVYNYESIIPDKFKYLLKKGAKLKVAKDGCSVLHVMASTHTDLDLVRCVIKAGGDVNCRDKNGRTPLHEAVTAGDISIFKLLIENGAEFGRKNSTETRLLGRTLLHEAVSERNVEMVKFLVENDAEVNAVDKYGNSVLHEASIKNDYFLIKYLVEKGALLDAKTNKGRTVLHEAAGSCCFSAVKFFVENGADVNLSDKEGRTALHETAGNIFFETNESLNVMKFLIEKGAAVNTKMRNGRTPLYESASNCNLHQVKILVANGADVNAKEEYGYTPIFPAVGKRSNLCIEFLVENGANLAHKADDGRTILHEACTWGDLGLVEYLIEMGADVNAKTDIGQTPLHNAARKGKLDIVKFLVRNRTDVDAKTTQGHTALDEATKGEHAEVIQYLKENNTEVKSKQGQ